MVQKRISLDPENIVRNTHHVVNGRCVDIDMLWMHACSLRARLNIRYTNPD